MKIEKILSKNLMILSSFMIFHCINLLFIPIAIKAQTYENIKFKNLTIEQGFPQACVKARIQDKNGYLSLGTNDGLAMYSDYKFNRNSYYKGRGGEMTFNEINRCDIFIPEGLFTAIYIPEVEFDEFKLNGVEVRTLNNQKLKYDHNTSSVKVLVPDFKNTDNIKYYYRLRGHSDEWMPMDTNETALFNLNPGSHVFEVKVRNSNNVFCHTNNFCFEINPVFWKSRIAIFMHLVIILLCIYIVIYIKDEKMKILNSMVDERTKKLNDEMVKNVELLNKVISLEKNKNSYLVNMSHELRTSLNVLSSIEQTIRELNRSENGIGRDKINHYMDIAKSNIDRLLKLINDIVDSSKIEHGNYNLQIEKNDIVYIVEEAALSLKDYVETKGIDLIIDPQVEECLIDCDKNEIERCVVNFINNAAKFTEPGGKIVVSLIELDDTVKIEVTDTGIGIEQKYLETIFDRFNQVIDENRNDKKGSGLGLTITRLIVNLHKGNIFVKSKVNEGSTFTIILPKVYE